MADFNWKPTYVFKTETTFCNIKTEFESGAVQRRQKWPIPKYTFYLIFNNINNAVKNEIESFFASKSGGFNSFTFSYPDNDDPKYETEYTVWFKDDTLVVNTISKDCYNMEFTLET